MSFLGKRHSEESKRKMREVAKGRKKVSEETKRKMSEKARLRKGENNNNWKGGQLTDGCGYVLILMSEHPRADNKGYVRRAHLVAEKMLGRYLYPEEITHHENEIRNDDRPENIEVMTRGKHMSFHRKMQKIRRFQKCQI